jgi:hypothetical protein
MFPRPRSAAEDPVPLLGPFRNDPTRSDAHGKPSERLEVGSDGRTRTATPGAIEDPAGLRSLAKLAICDHLRVEARGVLYWRRKRGPFEAKKEPSPNDVGLAWVVEADGSERYINNGEPIRRAEAVRLATAGEYTLDAEQ